MATLGRRFDFQIAGKGFMLQRGQMAGRSWQRSGRSDAPSERSTIDAQYGTLPDELDHPEVWNDWTGGFGYAYRDTGAPTYHWAENFDARFPHQLVHCQQPIAMTAATVYQDIRQLHLIPPIINVSLWTMPNRNAGVMVAGGQGNTNIVPNTVGSSEIKGTFTSIGKTVGRPVTVGSGILTTGLNASGNPYSILLSPDMGANISYGLPYLTFIPASDRTWIAIGGSGNLRPCVRSILGDPTATANLTASLLVGGASDYPISDMAIVEDQLFVGLGSGLFAGDQTGTFVNVMPQIAQAANPDNFRDLMPYSSGLLAQTTQGVYFYGVAPNSLAARIIEVPIYAGRSPVQGYVRALGHYGQWVYAARWTGSSSYLLATNDIFSARPAWHTLQHFPSVSIGRMYFDGITTPSGSASINIPQRAYMACDTDHAGSAPLYVWPTMLNDDNPLGTQPAWSANYIGSARIDLGVVSWRSPGTKKIFRDVEVWSNNLASGAQWCKVSYDVDNSGSFTLLGTIAKSPMDTLYFSSGEGSFLTGQSIELSLQSFTGSPGVTPVYRSVVIRGALMPRVAETITAVVRIADNLRDRQGHPMRAAATMLKELRDFGNVDANNIGHQLIDLAGATQWVKVLGHIDEQEVYQEGDESPEVAAKVVMAVLTYS